MEADKFIVSHTHEYGISNYVIIIHRPPDTFEHFHLVQIAEQLGIGLNDADQLDVSPIQREDIRTIIFD